MVLEHVSVQRSEKQSGDCRTEKIMRKKGLKWSNISVKKYHHRPGLGVKSGNANLAKVGYTQR